MLFFCRFNIGHVFTLIFNLPQSVVYYVPRQRIFYNVWIKNATDAVLNLIQVYRITLGNITSIHKIQEGNNDHRYNSQIYRVSPGTAFSWLVAAGISVSGLGGISAAVVIAVLDMLLKHFLR